MQLYIGGDSILKGVMFRNNRYSLFPGHRMERLAQAGVEVHNYSKMGATVVDGLAILEKRLPEDLSGATVLLEYGGNDCNYSWPQISDAPDAEHDPCVAEETFLTSYLRCIQLVRERGGRPVMTTLVPLYAPRFMDWISRGLQYDRILHWLGDVERLYRWQEYYSTLTQRVAREAHIPQLDLRAEFTCARDFGSLLGDDGIHPTEEGHRRIQDFLLRQLAALPA